MSMPFVTERVYDAPIETVWRALTDKDAMREWYFSQLREFEPVVRFEFRFTNDGSVYQKEWRVTQIRDGKKTGP